MIRFAKAGQFSCRSKFSGSEANTKFLILAFIFLVSPLGFSFAVITPPGQVIDEPAHVIRAQALLHGAFVGQRQTVVMPDGHVVTSSGVYADPGPLEASFLPGVPITAANVAVKSRIHWLGTGIFMPITPIAIYFPVFYVPAAIGVGFGRIIGISPYHAIYAARLAALSFYLLFGFLALLLARKGQALTFLALSVPMSLSLGASCNPDGMLIATAALGAALISRGARGFAAVCVGAIILVKPPYAFMALMLLLPLPSARQWLAERRMILRRLVLAVITIFPGIFWLAYALYAAAAASTRQPYHPGPLWPGSRAITFFSTDAAAQLRVVLAHPIRFTEMVWASIITNSLMLKEIIGIFGWLSIFPPPIIYTSWTFGIIGAVAADGFAQNRVKPGYDMLLILFVLFSSIFLIWFSQYLNWTDVGMDQIDGPTGRYLLPLIPLLGLALPSSGFQWNPMAQRFAMCLPIGAAAVTVFLLPRALVTLFYG